MSASIRVGGWLVLSLSLWSSTVAAAPPEEKQLLNDKVIGYMRCDLQAIWKSYNESGLSSWLENMEENPIVKMRENWGTGPEALERAFFVFLNGDQQGPRVAVLLRFSKPFDREKIKAAVMAPPLTFAAGQEAPPPPKPIEMQIGEYSLWRFKEHEFAPSLCFIDDQTLLVGDGKAPEWVLLGLKTPSTNPLIESLKRSPDAEFSMAIQLDQLKDLLPGQPPMPLAVLLKARSLFVSAHLKKGLQFLMEGTFANETDAKNAAVAMTSLLAMAKLALPNAKKEMQRLIVEDPDAPQMIYEMLPKIEELLGGLKPQMEGSKVVMQTQMDVPAGIIVIFPASLVWTIGENARVTFQEVSTTLNGKPVAENSHLPRPQSAKAMKKLAEALASYQADHGRLPPPAILSADGKPLLSWRVALLPYLGEEELYHQFKLNEPWNSKHNRKLLEKMPAVFKTNQFSMSRTSFRLFSGLNAPFQEKMKQGPKVESIVDGAANTILVTEARKTVAWTRPESLKLIQDFPLPSMEDDDWNTVGGFATVTNSNDKLVQGFYALMADGAVLFFNKKTDQATRKALFTSDGREVIPREKLGEVVK